MEVIIIDSGSTDGTLVLLQKYPVKIHNLPPAEFNHGETRNLGVQLATGEFVVMTVQDATPATDNWIELMLKHFEDPEVAGVCGQQIVAHDKEKNPLQWFRPASEAQPFWWQFKKSGRFYQPERKRATQLLQLGRCKCGLSQVNQRKTALSETDVLRRYTLG